MVGVSREYAINLARKRAHEASPPIPEWEAETWVEQVFGSLQVSSKRAEVWRHLDAHQLSDAVGSVCIDRETLRQAAAQYINELKWLHDRNLDWLIADVLAYAELDAFLLFTDKARHFRGSARVGARVISFMFTAVSWLVWLALIAAAFIFVSPLLGYGLLAITLVQLGLRLRAKRRQAELIESMLSVYLALNSATLSWSVLWDLMTRSRHLGAVWDPELYRLVELRK